MLVWIIAYARRYFNGRHYHIAWYLQCAAAVASSLPLDQAWFARAIFPRSNMEQFAVKSRSTGLLCLAGNAMMYLLLWALGFIGQNTRQHINFWTLPGKEPQHCWPPCSNLPPLNQLASNAAGPYSAAYQKISVRSVTSSIN
jgi:hypothetical protein